MGRESEPRLWDCARQTGLLYLSVTGTKKYTTTYCLIPSPLGDTDLRGSVFRFPSRMGHFWKGCTGSLMQLARTRGAERECSRVLLNLHCCVCVRLLSHVQLFVTPWTIACQAPLPTGFFQATILEWVAISSTRGSS